MDFIELPHFLRLVSEYGAGVFSPSLGRMVLKDPAELSAWIGAHPHLIDVWGEEQWEGALIKMNSKAHRHFGTATDIRAQNYYSLFDMFLLTAYQFERREFTRPNLRGHARMVLPSGERVGIYSCRFGLPPFVRELDTLVVPPYSRQPMRVAQLWAIGMRELSLVSQVRIVTPLCFTEPDRVSVGSGPRRLLYANRQATKQ